MDISSRSTGKARVYESPHRANPSLVMVLDKVTKTFRTSLSLGKFTDYVAVNNVSLSVKEGQTLAIIGESGSGKSTLAKMMMKLERPSQGQILLRRQGTLTKIENLPNKEFFKHIQMVFQDPYSSLNPRKRIWEIVTLARDNYERLARQQRIDIAEEYLLRVGLGSQFLSMYPHMLSGGQRQRVGIARALVCEPKILVLDEPLSALDISVQSQVVNLLIELQQELNLTYIFISHDISLVKHIADTVCVMHAGNLLEYGSAEAVLKNPKEKYTKVLINSSLDSDVTIEKCMVNVVNF